MFSKAIDLTIDDDTTTAAFPPIKFIPVNSPGLSVPQAKLENVKSSSSFPTIKFIPITPQPKPTEESVTEDACKNQKRDPSQASKSYSATQMEFIDHIVMIWLNRARRGDRKIVMPNSVIKARGKEAAMIFNKSERFTPTEWFKDFKMKMEQEDARGPRTYIRGYPSLHIADIAKEEWSKFFGDEISSNCTCLGEDEDNEDTIQTYGEALDCLKIIKDYAKSVDNFMAVELMTQMEDVLREGED